MSLRKTIVDRALRWTSVACVIAAGSLPAMSCGGSDESPLAPSNTDASRGGTAAGSGGSGGQSGSNSGGTGTSGTGVGGTGEPTDASSVGGSSGASGAQGAGATGGSGGTGGPSAGAGGVGGAGGSSGTRDASATDSNTPTDGSAADSTAPASSVACGATASCPTNPGRCCWNTVTAVCQQGASNCPSDSGIRVQTLIDCDGSEDCPTGQVCCLIPNTTTLLFTVKCASACNGLTLCNPLHVTPGDCVNGGTCRPNSGLGLPPEYYICGG